MAMSFMVTVKEEMTSSSEVSTQMTKTVMQQKRDSMVETATIRSGPIILDSSKMMAITISSATMATTSSMVLKAKTTYTVIGLPPAPMPMFPTVISKVETTLSTQENRELQTKDLMCKEALVTTKSMARASAKTRFTEALVMT